MSDVPRPWTALDDIEVYGSDDTRLSVLSHGVVRAEGEEPVLVIYVEPSDV